MNNWLKPVRLKDVFPLVNGVFSHISDDDYVFKCDVTKQQLDYLLMASFANKTVAPVVDLLHEDERAQLTNEQLDSLASMLLGYFKPKWDKLGEIYDIKYDPIHNYLDEWEDESDGTKDTDTTIDRNITDTLNTKVVSNSTRTDNLAEIEQHDLGNTNERTFENYKETNEYHSNNDHVIDANNPMKEEVEYGKTDTRDDDLTKTNTGEDTTNNSGTDTNAIWGFNSGNAVNSDSLTHGLSSTHTINGNNPLKETNTGSQTHTLSGKDTTINTGKYTENKGGHDDLKKEGKIKDVGTDTGVLTTNNTGTQTIAGLDANTGTNTREVDEGDTVSETEHKERGGKHFGNIGNLTSQKMIAEEIELWKWNYIQSILNDARDFLTITVYM